MNPLFLPFSPRVEVRGNCDPWFVYFYIFSYLILDFIIFLGVEKLNILENCVDKIAKIDIFKYKFNNFFESGKEKITN